MNLNLKIKKLEEIAEFEQKVEKFFKRIKAGERFPNPYPLEAQPLKVLLKHVGEHSVHASNDKWPGIQ